VRTSPRLWRWLVALGPLLALPALAAIPTAAKIAEAVAEANEVSGRTGPLLLEVSLRVGGGPPAATGVIASHPTGLARLELKSHQGFVERHLLQGDAYRASRNGELLEGDELHPFLPPVFLLQATSGAALSAALESFGVLRQEVVLGRLGEHDCYVFGGRVFGAPAGEEQLLPSLWVDIESYDPLRIVRADGVAYLLGPVRVFDGIRMPSWIEIQTEGLTARLDILAAEPADAPAAAFQSDWLTGNAESQRPAAPAAEPAAP
jgi:hypothetical protein